MSRLGEVECFRTLDRLRTEAVLDDRRVSGLRFVGKLPGNFDYSTEFVYQTGTVGATSVSAFAFRVNERRGDNQMRLFEIFVFLDDDWRGKQRFFVF